MSLFLRGKECTISSKDITTKRPKETDSQKIVPGGQRIPQLKTHLLERGVAHQRNWDSGNLGTPENKRSHVNPERSTGCTKMSSNELSDSKGLSQISKASTDKEGGFYSG